MPTALNDQDRSEFKQKLDARLAEVLEDTRQILLKSDDEQYIELAGRVHDIEEESVADLLVDLNLADIDRHVAEVRDIEAALLRIADLSYGECTDCGEPIALARLQVYPTAKRCITCQQRYEETHLSKRPTL